MKKVTMLLVIAALVSLGAYVVFAADQPVRGGAGMMGRGGAGMRGQGAMAGRGVMMNSVDMLMSNSTMVAVPDAVIVMMGNQLIKYDQNLNLVKQVELKFDWDSWQKIMAQRRETMLNMQ